MPSSLRRSRRGHIRRPVEWIQAAVEVESLKIHEIAVLHLNKMPQRRFVDRFRQESDRPVAERRQEAFWVVPASFWQWLALGVLQVLRLCPGNRGRRFDD